MKPSLIKLLIKTLRETAANLDAGNSELSDSEAMDLLETICHRSMSKAQTCEYLNTSPSNFGAMIRAKQMPKGRKVVGYKELRWYKDEIDKCVEKMKEEKRALQK